MAIFYFDIGPLHVLYEVTWGTAIDIFIRTALVFFRWRGCVSDLAARRLSVLLDLAPLLRDRGRVDQLDPTLVDVLRDVSRFSPAVGHSHWYDFF